jgi:hypothetical protein
LSLYFNWETRQEDVLGEWRYSSTHSLTSALERGEWSASRPGRFTSRERTSGTYWTGGWVGPRAVLDVVVKRKIPSPCRESNHRTPIVQPVAQRYTDWAITAHNQVILNNKITLACVLFATDRCSKYLNFSNDRRCWCKCLIAQPLSKVQGMFKFHCFDFDTQYSSIYHGIDCPLKNVRVFFCSVQSSAKQSNSLSSFILHIPMTSRGWGSGDLDSQQLDHPYQCSHQETCHQYNLSLVDWVWSSCTHKMKEKRDEVRRSRWLGNWTTTDPTMRLRAMKTVSYLSIECGGNPSWYRWTGSTDSSYYRKTKIFSLIRQPLKM